MSSIQADKEYKGAGMSVKLAEGSQALNMVDYDLDEYNNKMYAVSFPSDYWMYINIDETDEAIAKNGAINAFLKQGLTEKPAYDETIQKLKAAVS